MSTQQPANATDDRATKRVVEREITIDAPVDAVWKALTDADELTRWFPTHARVTPGEGGAIWMCWEDHYDAESAIEIWEPNRHLRARFPAERPQLATDYYLEGRGGGTVLRVVTSGFGSGEDWDEMFAGVKHGWAFELRGLQHYLENHRGHSRAVAWANTPTGLTNEEAWSRLTKPGGWLNPDGELNVTESGSYSLRTATGEHMAGTVQAWSPPRQFVGTVDGLNNAMFRMELEGTSGSVRLMLWLSTYDVPEADVHAIQTRWREYVGQHFAA